MTTHKLKTRLFAPADDFQHDGAGVITDIDTDGNAADVQSQDNVPTQQVKAAEQPTQIGKEDIAATVASTLAAFEERKQRNQPVSQQQAIQTLREKLGYYRAGKDEMEKFFSSDSTPETRAEVFASMQDKMYQHMLKAAQHVMEERFGEAEKRFQPVMSYYEQQQLKAQHDAFYAEHPGLEDHKELVALVARQLPTKDSKGNPLSREQQISTLVGVVKAQLKKMGQEIDPKEKRTNPQAESVEETSVPRSQPLRGSGRSAGPAGSPPAKSKDASIWE